MGALATASYYTGWERLLHSIAVQYFPRVLGLTGPAPLLQIIRILSGTPGMALICSLFAAFVLVAVFAVAAVLRRLMIALGAGTELGFYISTTSWALFWSSVVCALQHPAAILCGRPPAAADFGSPMALDLGHLPGADGLSRPLALFCESLSLTNATFLSLLCFRTAGIVPAPYRLQAVMQILLSAGLLAFTGVFVALVF